MARGTWVQLIDRGVVEVGGPDARGLLQGILSADLDKLAPARALYGALLTAQGKYLFDFVIAERDVTILLDCEAARAPDLVQRLTLYRLRASVTLRDASDDWVVLAGFGAGLEELTALPAERGAAALLDGILVLRDPRLAELGVRVLAPVDRAQAFLDAHGLTLDEPELYDRHRLALGVPDGSRDLLLQKSTLMESNFEELHGVAFDKGCFVGQELTARMKYRGLTRKLLVPVAVEGPLPAPETPILRAGREVGELRSGQSDIALALLRLDGLEPGQELQAGQARLRPLPPKWLESKIFP